MKTNGWFAVVYMFILTAVFSSIIIGVSRATRDKVEANKQIAFEDAVIWALPYQSYYDPNDLGISVHEIFVRYIAKNPKVSGAYVYIRDDGLKFYVLPIEGKGFWAPIKGVIGIAPDKKTITGIAFYEQNETPGLGGQITTREFRSQFINKKLVDGDKPIRIMPAGTPLKANEVHAITGATQTSTRLEKLINEDLAEWRNQLTQN